MKRTVYLAFYKGQKHHNPKATWVDRLICLLDGGEFSHVEIAVPNPNGTYACYSSSPRDGGVRRKDMSLAIDRWVLVPVQLNTVLLWRWFYTHMGKQYDWMGLVRTVITCWPQSRRRWFCSEMCAEILHLPNAGNYGVQRLYEWAVNQNEVQYAY